MNHKICATLFLISTLCLLQSSDAADDSLDDHEQSRVLDSSIDPNCTLPDCGLNIVYVRSSRYKNEVKSGPDLHFVLSTYDGSPAFFVASSKNSSTTEFHWSDLKANHPNSIRFLVDGEPARNNTIGVMISKIFFWLDTENAEAKYTPGQSQRLDLDLNGKWKNITVLDQTKDNVHVQYDLEDADYNGTISLRFMVTSTTHRYFDLPSLMLTPKSVHTQLTIEGFDELWPENITKRVGIEFAIASKGKLGQRVDGDPQTSFDDEYSPGMFIVSC